VCQRLAGTVEGNLHARRFGWDEMLAFLKRTGAQINAPSKTCAQVGGCNLLNATE